MTEFEAFVALMSDWCGLHFDLHQKYLLEKRLAGRLDELGVKSYQEYLEILRRAHRTNGGGELAEAMELLANHETYFFREADQLKLFIYQVLPELIRRNPRSLRVWSAGCSTGEEAYSLAILLKESALIDPSAVLIQATDISPLALENAREGVYAQKAFKGEGMGLLQEELRRKYFEPLGGGRYRIKSDIVAMTRFAQLNLFDEEKSGLLSRMDVIFCRNVIIYFSRENRKRVADLFWKKLRPGGILLLGHSETLNGIDERFLAKNVDGRLIYRKPESEEPS